MIKPLLLTQIMIPSLYFLLVEICNSCALWENTVGNLYSTITPEMKELAQEMAWNRFFMVFSYSCSLEGGGRNKTLRMKTNWIKTQVLKPVIAVFGYTSIMFKKCIMLTIFEHGKY